ncbi:hypothetical protein [Duganella sp. FT27W]|uniref:hypothetical protein n=1 Tax=Duganella sp. FT27W TaxID=2654636 RepID=UPI00128BBEF3|nr:hypothetical protein [Duganella sp. FT27W]MPQ57199.1 hypothetical protein [Duganella sp. FT27W]
MSADVGRTHNSFTPPICRLSRAAARQLMTVGAVRRQVGAGRNVGTGMQQRRRTHLAGRQLEPV